MSSLKKSISDYSSLKKELYQEEFCSERVVQLLKDELLSLLPAKKKDKTRETVSRLDIFEREVIRPYINDYLKKYDISKSPQEIKTLQSIKEEIMTQKYLLENYFLAKTIDAIIKTKDVFHIESSLRYLEFLFRENDSLGFREFICEQVKRHLPYLSEERQDFWEYKFDLTTRQP